MENYLIYYDPFDNLLDNLLPIHMCNLCIIADVQTHVENEICLFPNDTTGDSHTAYLPLRNDYWCIGGQCTINNRSVLDCASRRMYQYACHAMASKFSIMY